MVDFWERGSVEVVDMVDSFSYVFFFEIMCRTSLNDRSFDDIEDCVRAKEFSA